MSSQGTVLVTGGSGFIGGWCVIGLLQRGYTVRATVRNLGVESAVRAALGKQLTASRCCGTALSLPLPAEIR